jgi:hypothetical protein
MRWFNRWYGANPLHLLALIGCFALAWYAGEGLLHAKPVGVAVWFAGAVVGHDLILMPLYALADKSVTTVFRHRPPKLPTVPWINYLRVPVVLSGLLLLLWFPLIFKIPSRFPTTTDLSLDPYMGHWLVVTGALFLLSAVAFAFRLRPGRARPAPAWADETAAYSDPARLPQGPPAAQEWDGQDWDARDWDARGRRTGPYNRYGDPAGPPQRPRGAAPQGQARDRQTQDWQAQDRRAQEDWRTWDYSPGQGQASNPGSGRHRPRSQDDRPGPGQPRSEPPWPPQQWPGQPGPAQPGPAQPGPAGQWPGDGRYWADSEDDDLHWAEEGKRPRPGPGQPRPGEGPPWPYDR